MSLSGDISPAVTRAEMYRPNQKFRPMSKSPKPPAGLAPATCAWWRAILDAFVLEDHHLRILEGVCRAWDRAEEARARVEQDGVFVEDRFGQLKAHPGVDVERKARDQFRLLLRELGLDVAPPNEARAPQPGANSHLRLRA